MTDQSALVKTLQDQKVIQKIKHKIPGGKKMLDYFDADLWKKAVFNWLRLVSGFTEVEISFAKNPSDFDTIQEKVVEFDANALSLVWETNPRGRQYLADEIAKVLSKRKCVSLIAKKDGLYFNVDKDNKFGPFRLATEEDVEQYNLVVEELHADAEERGEEKYEFAPLNVGDRISSDDWEPYVEFIPKGTKQYGKSR